MRLTHGSGGVFDLSSTGPCLQKNSAGTEQVFSRKTRTQRMVERPSDHPAVVCGAQDSREWKLRCEDLVFFSSVGVLLALDRTVYLHKENGGRSNMLGEKEKEKGLPVESVIWYSRCCSVFPFSQESLECVETQ